MFFFSFLSTLWPKFLLGYTTYSFKSTFHQVVVLDDEGFHFYDGNGLYKDTILTGEGNKYRGSGKDILRYGRNTRPNLILWI